MISSAWFQLGGHVSLGDILVFAGAIAAAYQGWRLANATYELDRRNAARERKRRERQIRGTARLVAGELDTATGSIERAIEVGEWAVTLPSPHGAWNREGSAIVEVLSEDSAQTLIAFFSRLESWEILVGFVRGSAARFTPTLALTAGMRQMLAMILALAKEARPALQAVAYPDARDLEPDPDGLISYREQIKRRWLRRRP